jgi:uncharacterized protein (DUF2384 family)
MGGEETVAEVASVLDRLLGTAVLDAGDVARVVGATSRSVARWHSSGSTPRRSSEERLLELKSVVDLLMEVLRDEPARLWLRSPNPELDWEKPLDLVARGEYRKVIGVILALAEGVTA